MDTEDGGRRQLKAEAEMLRKKQEQGSGFSPEFSEDFSPKRTSSAKRKLVISFLRGPDLKNTYDLVIAPYDSSGLPPELEQQAPFNDKRVMQNILKASNKFESPFLPSRKLGLALFHTDNPEYNFREAIESFRPKTENSSILDTSFYSANLNSRLKEHLRAAVFWFGKSQPAKFDDPQAISLKYTVLLPQSFPSELLREAQAELSESLFTDLFDSVEIDGIAFSEWQEMTLEEKPSSFRTRSHLESDQPSPNDYLGFQSVADSVAAFVQHKSTRLPLCIAVDGPWGSGKSSMMLMIQEALQKGSTKTRERLKTAPGLFGSLRQSLWLTYLMLEPLIILGAIGFIIWWYGKNPDAPADSRGGMVAIGAAVYLYLVAGAYFLSGLRRRRRHKSNHRHFETVTINAWRYGEGVRLKASIVQSIITELLERRGARFFLKLRLLRLNRMALLTSLSKSLFQSWFFTLTAIAIGIGLMIYDAQGGTQEFLGALAKGLGQEAPIEHGNTILGFLLAGAGVLSQLSKNGDVANVSDFIANPDYQGLMGPDEEIEEDFRRILELLDEEGYTLAIFIDDLDRCSPDAVHKVVEALNVFFGQPDCRCLFILGMHKEMVATALEVAYSAIADKMAGNCLLEEQRPFGRRFLEKIVQFVLHVPKPREEQVETYLQHMTSGMTDADFRALAKQEADEQKPTADLFALRLERVGTYYVYLWRQVTSLLRLGRPLERTPPPQPIADRVAMIESDEVAKAKLDEERERIARFEARLEAAANFSEGSDENIRMFTMVRPALGSNPRQYKRYFNQLRFNRFITEDRLPNSEEKSLHTDAIMAAIALEFPEAYQWAYTNLQPRDGERNIDAALRHLKEKARTALPAHVKDLETARDMGDRVHYLLKQHPHLVHLIKLTASKAA